MEQNKNVEDESKLENTAFNCCPVLYNSLCIDMLM